MAVPSHLAGANEKVECQDCLSWEGFPSLFWKILKEVGYPSPPVYFGREYAERGVTRCSVRMEAPVHPEHPDWPRLGVVVHGHRFPDTWELAAFAGLNQFTSQHHDLVDNTLVGFLPSARRDDPQWLSRYLASPQLFLEFPRNAPAFFASWMKASIRMAELLKMSQDSLLDFADAMVRVSADKDIAGICTSLDMAAKDTQIRDLQARIAELTMEREHCAHQVEVLTDALEEAQAELHEANAEMVELEAHMEVPEEDEAEDEAEDDAKSELDDEELPPVQPPLSPTVSRTSVNDVDDF
nr:unnamed protein product [Digitaria exilis]